MPIKAIRNTVFCSLLMLNGLLQAHNLIPNQLAIQEGDAGIRIHGKFFTTSNAAALSVNVGDVHKSAQQFGNLQIIDFEVPKDKLPITLTVLNGAPTSIEYLDGATSRTWLEQGATFIVNKDIKTGSTNTILNYLSLGIEHILIGFDHLLFVLGLLFIVKRKSIILTISAFTLAHSITLGLAISGVLSPAQIGLSSMWVEAMIAASILILAIEMRKPTDHSTFKSASIAFAFGLLHGFGFAGVLEELGLPSGDFWKALISFNVGVEIGQLMFISILILLFKALNRNKKGLLKHQLVFPVSILVGGLAAFWFIERSLMLTNII